MYTLLLVDDEEEVMQVIEKKVKWNELGFSVVGHANNGFKALEMLEEIQPDVVMTDIKMPYMDGLELCGNIKEKYPATKILLFTGFDDFEYAKEAVHLEIEEYILKPLNAFEITEVFERLRKKLDEEISEKRGTQRLKKYYFESLPLLQANFYSTLIEGCIPEKEISKYIQNYEITFTGPWYDCVVIHTSSTQTPNDIDSKLLAVSVERQAKEQLEEKWRAKCFNYLGDTVLIVQLEEEKQVSNLTDACNQFCKYMNHIIGAVVTVGIGQACNNIMALAQSYQSAREAVSYRVLYGSNQAINLNEIVPQKKASMYTGTGEGTELAYLFKMVCLGKKEDIKEAAKVYTEHKFLPSQSLEKYHITVMELISELYHFMVNNNLDTKKVLVNIGDLYNQLSNMEPKSLEKWLLAVCLSLHEELANVRYHSKQSLIDKAKEYVRNNYKVETLGLDDICKELGVSNSYFSSIFKKETGKSFVGYLTSYRMDKAARKLIETTEKSYMIAKSVGYLDPNYFSYVFKRQYGVSPSKYRIDYGKSIEK